MAKKFSLPNPFSKIIPIIGFTKMKSSVARISLLSFRKPSTRSSPRAASKVAIIENGKVLMVRAARGITKGIWNLPGGFVGYGEHPAQSAQREVMEELGIRVKLSADARNLLRNLSAHGRLHAELRVFRKAPHEDDHAASGRNRHL